MCSPWSSKLSSVYHPWYITFLYTAVEQVQIKRDFHAMAGLPNIIGAIDCTHMHQSTRAVVEHTELRAKWVSPDTAGGGKLLYSPEKACQIILACCVLQNIAMNEGLPLPEPAQVDKRHPTWTAAPSKCHHDEATTDCTALAAVIKRLAMARCFFKPFSYQTISSLFW